MPQPSRRRFLSAAALAPLVGCVHLPGIPKGDPSPVAEANNAFGGELYAKLGAAPGNVFFSPFGIIFRADRPFAFAIRHIPSNTVLFLGRVTELG